MELLFWVVDATGGNGHIIDNGKQLVTKPLLRPGKLSEKRGIEVIIEKMKIKPVRKTCIDYFG